MTREQQNEEIERASHLTAALIVTNLTGRYAIKNGEIERTDGGKLDFNDLAKFGEAFKEIRERAAKNKKEKTGLH